MISSFWLHLASNSYRLQRIDPGWRLWKLCEDEDEKVDYLVRCLPDGSCTCDCPAFVFRHANGVEGCKHISALQEHGLLTPAPATVAAEPVPELESSIP